MSVGLSIDCKVGTEGGGTAIPRLDLHSRDGGKKLFAAAEQSQIPSLRLSKHRNYVNGPKKLQQLQLQPTSLEASMSLWFLDYRLFSESTG